MMGGGLSDKIDAVRREIGFRIMGHEEVVEHMMVCLFSGGHILLESPPGLGKTKMSKCLAQSMDLAFRRIQCTSDLTPSDVIGEAQANEGLGCKVFQVGPLFTNILLVDEINRAQPKTQAAFLEAMGEGQVTVAGRTCRLPMPFMLVATQNPVESDGTYNLPEAQEDRFLLKSRMTYLSRQDEKRAILSSDSAPPMARILGREDILFARERIRQSVSVGDPVLDYIVSLVAATRHRKEALVGASTRAAVLFAAAAKSRAFLSGRFEVSVEDVWALAHPLMRHRLIMNADARNFGYTSDDLIHDILRTVEPPSV
jgi:MoxR-like ATPase